MGGNALKSTPTRRYDRGEFDIISVELINTLKKTFKRVEMPLFYKNKQSFGDADVIVSMEGFNGNIRDYITDTFKPNEIFHNGNCYSFDYKELQIDIITLAPEHFDSNYNYLSYNDLGNYLGKIAHGFGLRYGQEGFWLEHYFKGVNIGKVHISKDYDKIYTFLGLSYDRWKEGFNELEDIFEFVSKSPYFNWEYLELANNNKVNRERDKKRKSYMSFLAWIEANVKDDDHRYQYNKDKTVYYDMVSEAFPEANLELEIRRMEYEYCKSLYIKAKFNGGDIMRKYGFKGKELGDNITGFKQWIGDQIMEGFEHFILNYGVEFIYDKFDQYLDSK